MGGVVSPLAPAGFPNLPAIAGARVGAAEVNIRYRGRPDVFLAVFDPGTTVAAVVTRSLTRSAPVDWCAAHAGGPGRVFVANAGNSNAFTGRLGVASVERTVAAAAQQFGCSPQEVFPASTGVIGEPLDDAKITNALPSIALSADGWADAARAIMTTDTFPKGAARTCTIGGKTVTLVGIAKGSGMIQPDMATMLAFCATDAAIPGPILQTLLRQATDRSFNCITVDSDTSTSDTLLLAATGQAGNPVPTSIGDPALRGFKRALLALLQDLAIQVVKDGEGAEKLITVTVQGAASARAARLVGLTIANSPLVKTAIAGEDANWGRIVAAVGKSGQKADRDRLAVWIGGVLVASDGQRVEGYDETPVAQHIKTRDIHLKVDLGVGRGAATVWTCDLTHRYIDINASYRS
ncbi:MAG: bifunctional glutamate N-acetyltransferase/amino-acid acetyltransferase ArgJ [Alphaproteobacteria bacterium]|nr:bifunctional glutamate N-acetyltransferase/amino-acid acetyltransferase ArgJ [Alphaproteobacteria bacterium]